jgi:hypothetical protein
MGTLVERKALCTWDRPRAGVSISVSITGDIDGLEFHLCFLVLLRPFWTHGLFGSSNGNPPPSNTAKGCPGSINSLHAGELRENIKVRVAGT